MDVKELLNKAGIEADVQPKRNALIHELIPQMFQEMQ